MYYIVRASLLLERVMSYLRADSILRHSAPPCYIAEINRYSSVGFRPTGTRSSLQSSSILPNFSKHRHGWSVSGHQVPWAALRAGDFLHDIHRLDRLYRNLPGGPRHDLSSWYFV